MKNKSKEDIVEAFYSLSQSTPIDHLSVDQICRSANVSRTTFYRYFSDKLDLLTAVCTDGMVEKIMMSETISDNMFRELEMYKGNRAMFIKIFRADDFDLFFSKHVMSSYRLSIERIRICMPKFDIDEKTRLSVQFFSYGYISMIYDWMKRKCDTPTRDLRDCIMELLPPILKECEAPAISRAKDQRYSQA